MIKSLQDERSSSRWRRKGRSPQVQAEGGQAVQEQGSQSWTEGVSRIIFYTYTSWHSSNNSHIGRISHFCLYCSFKKVWQRRPRDGGSRRWGWISCLVCSCYTFRCWVWTHVVVSLCRLCGGLPLGGVWWHGAERPGSVWHRLDLSEGVSHPGPGQMWFHSVSMLRRVLNMDMNKWFHRVSVQQSLWDRSLQAQGHMEAFLAINPAITKKSTFVF